MSYDFCTNYSVLQNISILTKIFQIVCIIVPLLIIIFSMIDYFKGVVSSDEDEIKKATIKMIRRIISGVVVFFVPSLGYAFVNFLNNSLSMNIELSNCVINSTNLEYYKELEEINKEKKRQEEEEKKNEAQSEKLRESYAQNIGTEGTNIGKTYNLTDNELNFFTAVALCENGVDGVKAEASLMANLYELQSKYSTLYDYVKKSGWFSCAKKSTLTSYSHQNANAKSQVKSVLVLGNRTLPFYVNEHDCWDCNSSKCNNGNRGDICSIKTNGNSITKMSSIKNKNNYKKDSTIVYNLYDSVYTFYTFPCNSCDPFGYTAAAKNKYDSLNGMGV